MGEERVIAFDMPGTTRDAIEIDFERDGRRYADRHGRPAQARKVFEAVEKFSVIKTLQAIEASNVVLLMLDARPSPSRTPTSRASCWRRAARWWSPSTNGMAWTPTRRNASSASSSASCASCPSPACTRFRRCVHRHAAAAQVHQRRPQRRLRQAVHAQLTRELQAAVEQQPPPARASSAPRCATRTRAARAAGRYPRQRAGCGAGFLPALETRFRNAFDLAGTPLRIEFKSSHNPYAQED